MRYKTEHSYLNRKGYLKMTHNQVRENKETTKFKKINTTVYDSIVDEMKNLHDYEYICAGLNSYEREVVIIDTDDDTYGKKTMELLSKDGLIPHFQKVKPNGHSQTFFFINKHRIGRGYFMNHTFMETDYSESHDKWKRLTKMMNFLYNGDICYTGYNCQNPFYDNADVKEYKSDKERYSFDELYDKCISRLSHVQDLDSFLRTMRRKSLNKKSEDNISAIITNGQLSTKEVEKKIDIEIKNLEDSINKRIFVVCCQIAKSFKMRNRLNKSNLSEICRTAYKNFVHQDEAIGYTSKELWDRINSDINQIICKDMMNKMEWNKVGYTKEQRERSLKTRQDKKENRKKVLEGYISTIITNGQLSENKLAKYVKAEYNIHHPSDEISERTARRYVHEILSEKKEDTLHYDNDEIKRMVESALEDETVYIKKTVIENNVNKKSEGISSAIITNGQVLDRNYFLDRVNYLTEREKEDFVYDQN